MRFNFVYTTSSFDKEVKRYPKITKELDTFKNKLAKNPFYEPEPYKSFPGNYHKIVCENLRLVLTCKKITKGEDEYCIYIAVKIFQRGESLYLKFKNKTTKEKERDTLAGKSLIVWNVFEERMLNDIKLSQQINEPRKINAAEYGFLNNKLSINHDLFFITIYETEEWITKIQKPEFDFHTKIANALKKHVSDNIGEKEGWYSIELEENFITIILYHQIIGDEQENWILSDLLYNASDDIINEKFEKKKPVDFKRCYGAYYFDDPDGWRKMELKKKTNMDLSPKQMEIIYEENKFPLFITGRAGSGKSTVLQFLFAEIILRYFITIKDSEYKEFDLKKPAYISYNTKLTEDARDQCENLFETNKDYQKCIIDNNINYKEDIYPFIKKREINESETLNSIFFEFSNLLKLCIDEEDILAAAESKSEHKNEEESKKDNAEAKEDDDNSIKENSNRKEDNDNPNVENKENKEKDNIEKKSDRIFPQKKYWNFNDFRKEWDKTFGKLRKINASISWHVIRTYIKGWKYDQILTPEEYKKIGFDNQSVTPEIYNEIYNDVWLNWYKYKCPQYFDNEIQDDFECWDDQDLVRYCLNLNLAKERFSAIFCDESQDFTRAELEFILKSSLFTNRKITDISDVNKFPFVFAGDNFQTLNPTGFSWASLSSYFTERLCEILKIDINKNKKNIEIVKPNVMSENFRSTVNIVKLANRIQLLRAARFEEQSEPQTTRFSKEGSPVICIKTTDKLHLQQLIDKKVVLIIPPSESENKKAFIKKSPLNEFIKFGDGKKSKEDEKKDPNMQNNPKSSVLNIDKDNIKKSEKEESIVEDNKEDANIRILYPTEAKGLDYPNVAIYGFNCKGNNSAFQLNNLLNWFAENRKVEDSDIELKYEITNAYVAATRAKSCLFIIDEFNDKSFWSFAFNFKDINTNKYIKYLDTEMLFRLNTSLKEKWDNAELGFIKECTANININDDNLDYMQTPEYLADFEREAGNNPGLLSQAASNYREVGDKIGEARCNGKYYLNIYKYEDAAEQFVIAKMYDEAIDCFWNQLNLDGSEYLISRITRLKDNFMNLKLEICLKSENPSLNDYFEALRETKKEFKRNRKEFYRINAWEYVLKIILDKVHPIKEPLYLDIHSIIELSDELQSMGLITDMSILASKLYKIGEFKMAVDIWEIKKLALPKEYYLAKLKTIKYPETIEFYEGTKDADWSKKLLLEYRQQTEAQLDDKQKGIVFRAILLSSKEKNEYERFLPFMLSIENGIESSKSLVKKADNYKSNINKLALFTLIETRFSNLQDWEKPSDNFVDKETILLIKAVELLKTIRQEGYVENMGKLLEKYERIPQKKAYFNANYKMFSRTSVSKLVFFEVGKLLEATGTFLNSLGFYEWAQDQTDDNEIKQYLRKRYVACKERQAEHDKSDKYTEEAINKRKEYNIPLYEIIPVQPQLENEDWEKLYEYFSKVSSEVKELTVSTEKERVEEENKIKDKQIINMKSTKKIIEIDNYSITVFTEKNWVRIKEKNDNEYSVTIKNGNFPDDAEMYLKESRIYTADDMKTPFEFVFLEDHIAIKVYDEDEYTGISLFFDINN